MKTVISWCFKWHTYVTMIPEKLILIRNTIDRATKLSPIISTKSIKSVNSFLMCSENEIFRKQSFIKAARGKIFCPR